MKEWSIVWILIRILLELRIGLGRILAFIPSPHTLGAAAQYQE